MKVKRNGFLILENVISLSLIGLISSLVVSVLSTSIFCISRSYKSTEMLNIAKKEMCDIVYSIDNTDVEEEHSKKMIKDYEIDYKIEKSDKYYNCYKVDIAVRHKDKEVKLNSYVVKS